MPTRRLAALACLLGLAVAAPAAAQELPDEGQSAVAFAQLVAAKPRLRAELAGFERWLVAKRVANILPTWQILRTASMWGVCNGPPFEVPPRKYWPNVAATLRFVRDQVRPALGPVEAVSAYRNPALNACARGARGSAHRDYSAIDMVPQKALSRRQIFNRLCPIHRRKGPASGVGIGFYAYTRFHIDTRSYRRWGSAGPQRNESPCALVDRGEDPDAPIMPVLPVIVPPVTPVPSSHSSPPAR